MSAGLLGNIGLLTSPRMSQYALTILQSIMERENGWETLTSSFILRVVQLIASPYSPINVCRPATAILKKLVEAHPSRAPNPSTSTSTATPPPDAAYRFGFAVVFEQIRKARGFLETLVNRLGSAETATVQNGMNLLNALLSHVNESRWDELIRELERLNVRKAVVRLMTLHEIEELTSCILDFQANILRVTVRKRETAVDPVMEDSHDKALQTIWEASGLEEEYDRHGDLVKWRKLGFETEDMTHEFRNTGALGLGCLVSFVLLSACDAITNMWLQRSFIQSNANFSMVRVILHS